MAQKVLVEMVDDIDGGVANQTVPFGLDGVSYEIDLSDANAAALRDELARYITAGRRIGGRKVRLAAGESAQGKKPGAAASDRERSRRMREWANANGYTVSERGRLSAEVVEAFEANDGQPIVVDEPAPLARKRAPRKKVAAAKK
ncbi:Lsr2 family protein [Amycolatopsis sp. DG1A-15b]|uniref:histone-like nucleoid-structuring protein Lsr2 n=1 Tax=Amycolatopsis sp. DG1A-15b TaxID=3052846 RepID=UPI00255BC41A|nr:Lsr2 family protein [Amycolatopsis sp. DG1A-15b]WIX85795.1 Lsr2 family protein [Amycolatopsis sp. DG1A-15b]